MELYSWAILIMMITIIMFAAFYFILGLFNHQDKITSISDDESVKTRRHIGLIILISLIIIMAVTGIDAFIHKLILYHD